MKQVLQSLRSGETSLAEVPAPGVRGGQLLVRTCASLISAGTERMLVEFGKASLLAKARSQPDKVAQVLDKIATDGLLPTLEAVFNRLDEPLPLGYCNAGVVMEVGAGVSDFRPGDRVVSNGPHAEVVSAPKNLCAKIPDGVEDRQASFTVLASIGLQGVRLLAPTLGERVVVFGLGLIGLVTVQLLRANGCEVLGIDLSERRVRLAEKFGARGVCTGHGIDPIAAAGEWTGGRGVDGVVITASAKTSEIVHQAAQMSRKRGRIVLVGVVGLDLRRSDFYEKELAFQVSCSYGPGRYDEAYEQKGQDYPLGLVRWTEQRNFEAVLDLLASRRLDVEPLITHRFPLADAVKGYDVVTNDPNALGVVLEYDGAAESGHRIAIPSVRHAGSGKAVVGVIGAGNFSKMTLMPALAKTEARLRYVADLNGVAATHLARKYHAENAVTDYHLILHDGEIQGVLIAVGHHLHAQLVSEVLRAGKHVFVEKPLAMNPAEVGQILDALRTYSDRHVMVGFNRRFSPHAVRVKELLRGRTEPLAMTMLINAGMIPPDHWVHDPARGGGRIIGEACHFIDLMVFLTGSPVRTVSAAMMDAGSLVKEDKMGIVLGFEDGSVGTVNYFANGSKSYPKEELTVFSDGRVLRLDNFRKTTGYGFKGFRTFKTWRQDKGHAAEFAAFVDWLNRGGGPLIPLSELVNVTYASFAAMAAAREHRTVDLNEEYGTSGA